MAFCGGQQLGYGVEEGGNGPLPPAREGGVVHGDFAGGVEDVPGLDLDGEGEVDRLEEELETAPGETSVSGAVTGFGMREEKGGGGKVGIPSRSRSDVLARCKVRDLVSNGNAQEAESAGVVARGQQVRKEAEEVLGVQFAAIKGARNVHTALNVLGQEGRIDHLGLR